MTTKTPVLTDPAGMPAINWSTRLAALKSHGLPDDDPQVAECKAALAFWRCRRALDAERGRIAPAHLAALVAALRRAVAP